MGKGKDDFEGLILVNKPAGITSHDVVDIVRRRLGIKKVGHAGTLDPLAEGLLVILVGRYTKFFKKFVEFKKEYVGILKLGETTTTGDSEGDILNKVSYHNINKKDIINAFKNFVGEIEQIPPMVSAKRINGKRLYILARKGIVIERKPRKINIYKLKVLDITLPLVKFYVQCSKGTYIRKLAEDIGEELRCGAHIIKIQRKAIGPFRLDEAVRLEEVNKKNIIRTFFSLKDAQVY